MPDQGDYRMRRVGHKGADRIAPGNTLASFDAALATGVDMIEFDVLPAPPDDRRPGRESDSLLLAHDYVDAARRSPCTLEGALAHLSSERFGEIELDVDLKLPGYELRVLEALRAHRVLERALISSQYRSSLAVIRAAEPGVRLGWSVPKLRHDPFRTRALALPATAALYPARAILPTQAARALRARECDALMVHWRLVTHGLVQAVRRTGGELYVWTVDEVPRLRALQALGVTGVITNDPRLFAALAG